MCQHGAHSKAQSPTHLTSPAMSYNNDPSGRMVNGTYHGSEQLMKSGVTSWDDNAVAAGKLDQARMSQQEHDNRKRQQEHEKRKRQQEYVPLGHVEDMRSKYQKALSKAKIQNAMRLVLILMASAVLFFALNTIIGGNIRDNSLYGVKDKYSFSPMEVGLSGSGVSVSPALKQRGADDFQRRFGSLFKPGTPFVRMFDGCDKKFNCMEATLPAVLNLKRYALKPDSLLDDFCSVALKNMLDGTRSGYNGPLDVKFVPQKGFSNNLCVTANSEQINAIAAPLNARYKLAIGGMVFLPSVLLMALLFLFVPKTAMPIDNGL